MLDTGHSFGRARGQPSEAASRQSSEPTSLRADASRDAGTCGFHRGSGRLAYWHTRRRELVSTASEDAVAYRGSRLEARFQDPRQLVESGRLFATGGRLAHENGAQFIVSR